MSEAIIVAIITGGITLAGTVVSNMLNHSKTIYRIDVLERKVEKHNNFMERLQIAECKIAVIEEKQKDLDNDVDKIREKAGA